MDWPTGLPLGITDQFIAINVKSSFLSQILFRILSIKTLTKRDPDLQRKPPFSNRSDFRDSLLMQRGVLKQSRFRCRWGSVLVSVQMA